MPVPTVATYSAAALVAAHTAFKNLIDAGAGPGTIKIRNDTDVLLATIVLTDPCGTVNGTTGQLVFAIAARDAQQLAVIRQGKDPFARDGRGGNTCKVQFPHALAADQFIGGHASALTQRKHPATIDDRIGVNIGEHAHGG